MKQKKVTIQGKEFTLQSPGYRWYLDTRDESRMGNGVVKQSLMFDAYLKHVVVEPKDLSIEDFEDKTKDLGGGDVLVELVRECERFLTT